jgi:CubicO group peptidase (beta-lactamase class C family)
MQEHDVPGVMLAVVREDEVAYQKGHGVTRVPDGGLPNANTVSTSTPFTRSAANMTVVSTNGASGGFSSFFAFTPRRHDAISMLRNTQAPGVGIQGPCNAILASCCGIPNGSGGDDSND